MRRSALGSLLFIVLYCCVASALFLNFTHDRWGDQPWFLLLAGITGGTAVYVLRQMLVRKRKATPKKSHSQQASIAHSPATENEQ